jgi:hypothetical protein
MVACPVTAAVPPNACTMSGATGQQTASTIRPIMTASHSPSMPCRIAAA